MGIDFQTRIALDFVRGKAEAPSDVLFVGSPSLVLDDQGAAGYLEKAFPRGWESVDISANQQVNYVADFALEDLGKQFDLIVDHGSLQHFYDPFAGILNVIRHLKPNGRAVHMLPFTGYGGFGYWQVSPSIFQELEDQGCIRVEKVMYFSQYNKSTFFEPVGRDKAEFHFARRTRVCVVYRREGGESPARQEPFFQKHEFDQPQASEYKQRSNRFVFMCNQIVSVLWEEFFLRPAPWRGDNKYLKVVSNKDLT